MSIKNKLIIFFAVVFFTIASFNFWYFPKNMQTYAHESMRAKIKTMAEFIALGAGIGLVTNDFKAIDSALKLAKQNRSFSYIGVFEENKENLIDINPDQLEIDFNQIPIQNEPFILNEVLFYSTPIIYDGKFNGTLLLALNFDYTNQLITANKKTTLLVSFVTFVISLICALFFSRSLVKQLKLIGLAFNKIRLGEFSLRLKPQAGEIGAITKDINDLINDLHAIITDINQVMLKVSHGDLSNRIETPNLVGDLANLKNNINQSLDDAEKKNAELFDTQSVLKQQKRQLQQQAETLEDTVKQRTLSLQQEINERKLAEYEAKKANNAKTKFLSSMSHELRTPLNAILGFAQLLEMENLDLTTTQQEGLTHIITSGNHLLNLINDVLDLSSIESGKIELSIEEINLSDIISESISLIQPLAKKSRLNIRTQSNSTITLRADYTKLKQIIVNLLSNAIKYNNENGSISLYWKTTDDNMVTLFIKDTGIGIPKSKQHLVFTAFNRLGHESSKIEGTGIGLVLSKQLIIEMEGQLGFSSEENKGSTFWIKLPFTAETKEDAKTQIEIAQDKSEEQTLTFLNHKHILYIEDNVINIRLMQSFFQNQKNTTLYIAKTGEQGWDIMQKKRLFDLILMDIHLPGINGRELTKKIRLLEPYKNKPIIAVTAAAMSHEISSAKNLFDAYLTKPIDLPLLIQTLKKHLS